MGVVKRTGITLKTANQCIHPIACSAALRVTLIVRQRKKMTDIQRASLGKRLGAFMIDFLIAAIAQALLFIPFIIIPLIQKSIDPAQVTTRNLWCTLITFGYLILRDLPNGRSFGKKALNLQTLGIDAERVSAGRLILRNLFVVIYPVEAIWLLVTSGQKRLGDIVARTGVFVNQIKEKA